jgi:hypothetical protein
MKAKADGNTCLPSVRPKFKLQYCKKKKKKNTYFGSIFLKG